MQQASRNIVRRDATCSRGKKEEWKEVGPCTKATNSIYRQMERQNELRKRKVGEMRGRRWS
jgi:hypothetical protein